MTVSVCQTYRWCIHETMICTIRRIGERLLGIINMEYRKSCGLACRIWCE